MRTIFFFIWITLVFSSCSYNPAIKAQKDFTKQYSSQMYQSNNWRLYSYGDNFFDGINGPSFDFISHDHLDINSARILILENVKLLCNLINSNPQTSSFIEKPLDLKGICLTVMFFENNSTTYVKPPYIAYLNYLNGKIGYSVTNEKRIGLELIHRETYEEALQIINAEQGCLPFSQSSGNP